MKIKPCGPTVLVKIIPVDETFEGSSLLRPHNDAKREKGGRDIGTVVALGPTAYMDLAGVNANSPEDGANKWGYKIGDRVEFNRYDGKVPRIAELDKQYEDYRLIHDNDILLAYEE